MFLLLIYYLSFIHLIYFFIILHYIVSALQCDRMTKISSQTKIKKKKENKGREKYIEKKEIRRKKRRNITEKVKLSIKYF